MKKNNELVIIKDFDMYVGTWTLSKGFDVEHRLLTNLIKKYKTEFEELGFVAFQMQQIDHKKRGRRVEECLLNMDQYFFLNTLFRTSDKAVKFKVNNPRLKPKACP